MKTIKLLLCALLTAMSFNVFADEVGRYQMLTAEVIETYEGSGVYILDTKTGAIKFCSMVTKGMFVFLMFLIQVGFQEK